MVLPLALAGGSLVVAILLVAVVLGLVAYTVYAKGVAGIGAHPIASDDDPGTGRDQDQSGLQNPDQERFRETFDEGGR